MSATATVRKSARGTTRKGGREAVGPSLADDILARALSVVERLAAEYPAHAERDIRRLTDLAQRMAAESDGRAAHYDEVSRVAHDIRGQGALFGYPLMTRCADSLCRAVRILEPDNGVVIGLVRTHAAALHAILHHRSGGDRDPSTLFVVIGLEFFVLLRTRDGNY